VPGRKSIVLLVPWLSGGTFLVNKRITAYSLIPPWPSQSHVYLMFTMCKILSKVDMFNTVLNLLNESKSPLRSQA